MTYGRIREEGTEEIVTDNPADRIAAIRRVVKRHQYAKIDGTMIDGFTAGAIVSVYDALNDANKLKFSSLRAGKMGLVAFKLIK